MFNSPGAGPDVDLLLTRAFNLRGLNLKSSLTRPCNLYGSKYQAIGLSSWRRDNYAAVGVVTVSIYTGFLFLVDLSGLPPGDWF